MFKLLKGGHLFVPEEVGTKDILIVGDKIYKIEPNIPGDKLWDVEILDCSDKIVCPGFIDQHVHVTGGGGEQGPVSRIPELMPGDVVSGGVTTLVGLLGVDGITRSLGELLTKARALDLQGITTYIYTGNYGVPTTTLTGKIISDLIYIDKVIGVGEIAISDHRSSHPTMQMLKEVAYEANVGGMIGGKAGIVHIHLGDGKNGILPLMDLLDNSDFPIGMFVPTHMNRNKALFSQAVEYLIRGGNVDLTAGEKTGKGYSVPDALEILFSAGVNLEKVTISSDGNASIPSDGGSEMKVGKVFQLFEDVRQSVLEKKLDLSQVIKTVTSNVAKLLKIYPKKGLLQSGSDADILLLNKDGLSIHSVFARGELLMNEGRVLAKSGAAK